jgi:hypothetical protein
MSIQTTSTRFERELTKIINEEMARIATSLAVGMSVNDYASYVKEVGKYNGLKMVLGYFDEVNRIINEE